MALDPVKYEYSAPDGTAIASVNRHRNFFGERLGIRAYPTVPRTAPASPSAWSAGCTR